MDWHTASKDEREQFLREKADLQLSAGAVAAMFGVTRSTILGAAHRGGIKFHGTSKGHPPAKKAAPAVIRKVSPVPRYVPPKPVPLVMPEGARATIGTLKSGVCHFPMYKHPRERKDPVNLPYCGHPTDNGTDKTPIYCAFHRKTMYRPVEARIR